MPLLRLPKPAVFEARIGLELQQVYFEFSKRIALSGDASRGLGDPFCFGFPQRKTRHRRGEQEGEENKTENEKIQRASNVKKRRRNNE